MIDPEYLAAVAGYVYADIGYVRINGSLVIDTFDILDAVGDTVLIKYTIPAGTGTVSLIEVWTTGDALISSNVADLPVTSETVMTQTIKIKEATP